MPGDIRLGIDVRRGCRQGNRIDLPIRVQQYRFSPAISVESPEIREHSRGKDRRHTRGPGIMRGHDSVSVEVPDELIEVVSGKSRLVRQRDHNAGVTPSRLDFADTAGDGRTQSPAPVGVVNHLRQVFDPWLNVLAPGAEYDVEVFGKKGRQRFQGMSYQGFTLDQGKLLAATEPASGARRQ